MNPSRFKFNVQVLLFLIGGSTVLAIVPLFFPITWMRGLHEWLGLGEAPTEAIFEYMARSLCVMYFTHGVFVLSVAFNLHQCWKLVPVIAATNIIIGIAMLFIDSFASMPFWWLLFEGPPILAIGLILLWLREVATR
jgi:hypothetical protein